MNERLKLVINELKELNPIKEEDFNMHMVLDKNDAVLGVSIKSSFEGKPEEVIWIELLEGTELDVEVHPDIVEKEKDTQGFWAILYCLSANMKKIDSDKWNDLNTSEIAEEIYKGRQEKVEYTEELENSILESANKETEKDTAELPKEISITIDTALLTDIILSYNDDEVEVIVDFINVIAELSGIDVKLGLTEEPENAVGETDTSEKGLTKTDTLGLMDTNYVINNLTVIIQQLLEGDEEVDKVLLTFFNQLIHERVKLEEYLQELFGEE